MKKTTFFRVLIAVSIFVMTTACSGSQLHLNMSSTANLNLNEQNEPLPVMVNIYQLSEDKIFNAANFSDLWKKDLVTLGDGLLTKESLTLNPASQKQLLYDRHPQTRFVGVMAVFRKPEKEAWRSIQPVADSFFKRKMSSKLVVNLKGNAIEILD